MATFYVLPPRDCLDQAVGELLGRLLPGLPQPADGWAVVSEQVAATASWPADVYLVPRDDLPEGVAITDALSAGFGAEVGDRVVEVRLAGAARAWVMGGGGCIRVGGGADRIDFTRLALSHRTVSGATLAPFPFIPEHRYTMPEPTAYDEGGWGDLARELGVEAPASTPTPAPKFEAPEPPPLPQSADMIAEDEGFAEGLAGDEAEGDDADGEGEETAEGEGGEPGQPGTGRKRRRRRRRRSKKGGPEGADAAPAAAVAATVGEEEAGIVSAVPSEVDEQPGEEVFADDAEVEDEEQEARPLVAEEDTGNDVLRELISTWNVPAWDDIIGGLYRPDR